MVLVATEGKQNKNVIKKHLNYRNKENGLKGTWEWEQNEGVRKVLLGKWFKIFFIAWRGLSLCTIFSRQYKDKNNHLLRRSSIILGTKADSGFSQESL